MSTTEEIKNRIIASIVHELKKINSDFENSALENSVENAFAIAIAPEIKLLERLTIEAGEQGNPKTAESRQNSDIGSLEQWGEVILNRQPHSATPAEYIVVTYGATTAIPTGSTFADDNGYIYVVTSSTITDCLVQAVGEGSDTIQPNGTKLYLQQQIAGVNEEQKIDDLNTAPIPAETIEEYRDSIIKTLQNQPRGGALGDFRLWAEDVAGVYKAFPYTTTPSSGTVFILQERTGSNIWGTPVDASLLETVRDYLQPKQPIGAEITVASCIVNVFDITIELHDNTTEEQDKATEAIQNYFLNKFPFVGGIDNEDLRTDIVTQADLMQTVANAISSSNYLVSLIVEYGGVEIQKKNLNIGSIGNPSITFI